jgi:prolyl-tRNA synthetase
MKDMYSWHVDQADFDKFYAEAKAAYLRVFSRLGLVAKVTEASGGAFTEKISYEFEVLSDAGEAPILYCSKCDYCVNVDDIKTYKEGDDCPKCAQDKLSQAMASELGNVFDLGQKYTKAFDLKFTDKNGKQGYPIMGCYGIGISRTMGVLVETFHDERGIIWPESIAPYQVQLISIAGKDESVIKQADKVYAELVSAGIEVLYDDRTDKGAGAKLSDADLIGNPYRVVVSGKTGDQVEVKKRNEKEVKIMSVEELLKRL